MTTVFIGGSRHVSRLSSDAKERLQNVISNHFSVLVGDANGADKAVQKHLADEKYEDVTVFCSGATCRNNLGSWRTEQIDAHKRLKGFQFYAVKDREMARRAEFGLMIWDGKSPGTLLNVLRLVRLGKKAVLLNARDKETVNFKSAEDWDRFISLCDKSIQSDIRDRATAEELPQEKQQRGLFEADADGSLTPEQEQTIKDDLNDALQNGDAHFVLEALGRIAKARGMSQVAKNAGLARESLYRSLGPDGNPEFATVVKVLSSLGMRLYVDKAR